MTYAGVPFTVARFACSLLGDQMPHGYEMAAAIGRPWPIAGDVEATMSVSRDRGRRPSPPTPHADRP
jgi:hypothetical protein